MAVNDLTPQLRTRLNRLEKLVGWFVSLAMLLTLVGFGYYIYHTGVRKGWFMKKASYFSFLHTANALKVGDPVKLMGWDVGNIVHVTFAPADVLDYNVYVEFVVKEPFYGYIWNDSRVKVGGGLFGNRYLELTRGGLSNTNPLLPTYKDDKTRLTEILNPKTGAYSNYVAGVTKPYWLQVDEPPDISAEMERVMEAVRNAVPSILAMTNRIGEVLSNSATATLSLVALLDGTRPVMTNFLAITANLKNPKGSLGEWLLPTNVTPQLTQTLATANTTLGTANTTMISANTLVTNSDAYVAVLVSNLNLSLVNVAALTSNLHRQVEVNSNLVTGLNRTIVDTDDMVQGLKRHWFLRSAFKTNAIAKQRTNDAPLRPMFRK